jgi:4-hydroxy-tetrahydrodipicolinate reductase
VNILFAVNRYLGKMMDRFENYDIEIREVHHVHKLDAPSGTAISLASDLLRKIRRKEKWELDHAGDKGTLKITAVRENEIPGIHTVTYDSEFDELSIHHSAKSRKGFAMGAIMAAEFIADKKGVYTMSDLLKLD